MENTNIVINGPEKGLSVFKLRLIVSDLPRILDQARESITYISSFQTNLYIGTSIGKLLHYHKFEDAPEYIHISEVQISNDHKPVKKIVLLPTSRRALILIGNIVSVYTLPELSPCHIGKLKYINDISLISYSLHANISQPRSANDSDKVLALSSNKIRIIQVGADQIKLLKDINYSNAIKGVSTVSAVTSNYSNLGIVANKKNYDIIDLKQTRKIPLFDYNPEELDTSEVPPHIVAFYAEDKSDEEEYLLTIRVDGLTSMSMFINSLGDVTRGTISWIGEGYPMNGIVVEWPYVLGIFNTPEGKDKLVIGSLISLDIKFSDYIESVIQKESKKNASVERFFSDSKDRGSEPTEDNSEDIKIAQEDIKEKSIHDNELDHEVNKLSSYNICRVSKIAVNDEKMANLLSKMDFRKKTINSSAINKLASGSMIVYNNLNVWLLYNVNALFKLQDLVSKFFDKKESSNIILKLESFTEDNADEVLHYAIHLLVLVLIYLKQLDKCLKYLFMKDNEKFIINPLLVIYLLSDINLDDDQNDFDIFYGLQEFIDIVKKADNQSFLKSYLINLYPHIPKTDVVLCSYVRSIIYSLLDTSKDIISFIDNKDNDMWKLLDQDNKTILGKMKRKNCYLALFHIYQILSNVTPIKGEIVGKICDLSISILNKEIEGPEVSLLEDSFDLVSVVLDQLNKNFANDKDYGKYLLEILKIDPINGMKFLKENRNSKFKSTHKYIMNEMANSYSGKSDFSLLRIDYLESIFVEDTTNIETLDELLIDLTRELISDSSLNDMNSNNFEVLRETYRIENSLSDTKWPKISWVDYLNINMRRSECSKFIELYLKVYELLLIRSKFPDAPISKFKESIQGKSIFAFYNLIIDNENTIRKLLEYSDYSTAEHFALSGSIPLPTKTFYFEKRKDSSRLDFNSIKNNLKLIYDFYVNEQHEQRDKILATRHFISTYGNIYFTSIEILKMLPDCIPLVYIQDYLTGALIDLGSRKRNVILRKVLSKSDSNFTKSIYNDLTSRDM